MDNRFRIFIHALAGLKLSELELDFVLHSRFSSRTEVHEAFSDLAGDQTSAALNFLRELPDWWTELEPVFARSEREGIYWSHIGSEDYPSRWRTLPEKPLLFHYKGKSVWRDRPLVSVVGSRTPMTDTRLWMQRELAEFLRQSETGVVSGGARGVDQWAHRICLEAGRPTVAIFPSGLKNPYPFNHEWLWNQIVERGGALLSTFAMDEELRKWAFHRRNRWIAGLGNLCFVVEANRRSGSAMTGEYAAQQSVPICTIPVFPHSHQGLANLDLIIDREATIIRDWRDLLTCWNRSTPGAFQTANRQKKEDRIDEPERDRGFHPPIAGDAFGRDIANPVGHQ
jgi:DNA protecting protein DprA